MMSGSAEGPDADQHGVLSIVATPIGNLGDLSPRAVETLARADLIVCEDTRHTRKLLTHAGISGVRMLAMHEHNEAAQVVQVIHELDQDKRVALVTDAGTPAISDPGERLVAAAAASGFDIEVVPGPSAVIAALVVSGLETGRFVFEGFLPRKGRERKERLAEVAREHRTTVLYEAPHRLRATLADLERTCGPLRRVAVARELTKLHEEVWRGPLHEATTKHETDEPRGEYVLVLAGAPPVEQASDDEIRRALLVRIASGEDKKTAVTEVAKALNVSKRAAYNHALALGDGDA